MLTLSCITKFHAFQVAEQLQKNNQLERFYTTYAAQKNPFWKRFLKRLDDEEISPDRLRTNISLAIAKKILPGPNWYWNQQFDKWVAHNLLRENFDVFMGWSGMSLMALQTAKKLGKKSILVRSSAHIAIQNSILQEEYKQFGQTFSIPKKEIQTELQEYDITDYIEVPSTFAYNSFIEQGVRPDKLLLHPLGVSLKRFNPTGIINIPREHIIQVIYLGNLSLQKGVQYLFMAARQFARKDPTFQFHFIGQLMPEIQTWLNQNGLPDNCRLHGFVPQHQLNQMLRPGAIGVVPTLHDGFSQVIPQMLACHMPVVATPNCMAPDVIVDGENGFIVPARSPGAIVDKLQQLKDDPDLFAQMSRRARTSVLSEFSWEHYGQILSAFVREIA
jgi:glycosyltransferase involved in cell wall biosynthesis